jgi:arginyl-tRNA synthetase
MKESETLKNKVLFILTEAVQKFCEKKSISFDDIKVKIEYSRNEKFGDYSTSILLENKEKLGNPKDNSELLLSLLIDNSFFSKVDFTMPGFINFRISSKEISNYINQFIVPEKERFPEMDDACKIIFEFVSANPTGPLNIVSARAASMGDSICNLLQKTGNSVHREFYVNDFGNQVFLLGVSCVMRLREFLGEPFSFQEENELATLDELLAKNTLPQEAYRGEYIKDIVYSVLKDPEKKLIIDNCIKAKEYKSLSEKFAYWAVDYNLSTQKKDLENFGVKFDEFFSEKNLHDKNSVLGVLKYLEKACDTINEAGKISFLSTKYNDDKDRVIVREDGRPTYLLADIAYHRNKIERGFEKIINIWGPDHHGYIARLAGAMQSMGYSKDAFKVLIAQQVNLLSRGEKIKMSKRLGQFQTMNDLIEYLGEHSKDVGRYFFIMRALETPLDFDLDLAKEESEKNPVFYLQYAHAIICSIFREVKTDVSFEAYLNLAHTEERERLAFWIARFPEETLEAAKNFEPHRLATYLQNLAKTFSRFYIAKDNRLKDADEKTKAGLAYLIQTASICLKEGLSVLGVSAPEVMESKTL